MTVYDLMLEVDHDDVRKKISEAEAKSLTRTTKLGKAIVKLHCMDLSVCATVYICVCECTAYVCIHYTACM